MFDIEIDGRRVQVSEGLMIIEAAARVNIPIPRFCYHEKLPIAANCRMCLVQVEKVNKPLPACATPVTPEMRIWTRSGLALQAQRSVMEFLLINHPLDCPICDQGGECELQDVAMGYGKAESRFHERKRVVSDLNMGPLVASDMTRCIQCTRCVRFGSEIAGYRELGATGRGEQMTIGTYLEHNLLSPVSGNVIDLCPVGALTSKPFAFRARAWELQQVPGISPHDALGSALNWHVRRHKIMRVVPRRNEDINEVWLSDRDRYAYEGLYVKERLGTALIKQGDVWQACSLEEGLCAAAQGLQRHQGSLGALLHPSATIEEGYLLQKLVRGLGSHHIDHRLRQLDVRYQDQAPSYLGLGISLQALEGLDWVLLVGCDVMQELPVLGLRLRKLYQVGGRISLLNPYPASQLPFEPAYSLHPPQADLLQGMVALLHACQDKPACNPLGQAAEALVASLQGKGLVLLGNLAQSHPQWSDLLAVGLELATLKSACFGVLTEGANSAGLWLAGCVPHRLPGGEAVDVPGHSLATMLEADLGAYILLNLEPSLDCAAGPRLKAACQAADFVLGLSMYDSPDLRESCDVILPLAAPTETPGSYMNLEGRLQSFEAAVRPLAKSMPGWHLLNSLGYALGLTDWDHPDFAAVHGKLCEFVSKDYQDWRKFTSISQALPRQGCIRVAPVPLYQVDPITRRASALQGQMTPFGAGQVVINPRTAHKSSVIGHSVVIVRTPEASLHLDLQVDEGIPDDVAVIAAGLPQTAALGSGYQVIEIEAVDV